MPCGLTWHVRCLFRWARRRRHLNPSERVFGPEKRHIPRADRRRRRPVAARSPRGLREDICATAPASADSSGRARGPAAPPRTRSPRGADRRRRTTSSRHHFAAIALTWLSIRVWALRAGLLVVRRGVAVYRKGPWVQLERLYRITRIFCDENRNAIFKKQ